LVVHRAEERAVLKVALLAAWMACSSVAWSENESAALWECGWAATKVAYLDLGMADQREF
jgi:hypothetical protein